jgi:transglutaminase-like putative cysteine protease
VFKIHGISFLLVIFLLLPSAAFGQATISNIDKSKLSNGLVTINYKANRNIITKIMIAKGNIKYTYNLKSDNRFPLQLGDGKYTISILENVEGNKYKLIEKEEVVLNLTKKNDVFLQSVQNINWEDNMSAVKKAKELTKDAKNDQEKVTAIYNYIINNISYDYGKANNIKTDYIPSIDKTIKASSGICYDYSSLLAAMLRSVGVPTKLIAGYKNDIKDYHAWNQVYLKDKNAWVTIDTTYDSLMKKNKVSVSMIKKDKDYSSEKLY